MKKSESEKHTSSSARWEWRSRMSMAEVDTDTVNGCIFPSAAKDSRSTKVVLLLDIEALRVEE